MIPDKVAIREVALRDGLQIEQPIPLRAKLELLSAIAATGVREVEVTSFVSPPRSPHWPMPPNSPPNCGAIPTWSSPHWSPVREAPPGRWQPA